MRERDIQQVLSPPGQGDGDGEGWLMSYLDVLTLLITLFVLLLSMAGNGQATSGSDASGSVSPTARLAAIAIHTDVGPMASGLRPRHDGLQPRFKGLEMEGVSVAEGDRGITLRIDNNLLFASGQASLTSRGRSVLQGLVETLQTFDGRISVEGHTDNVPISTSRFPSNWELSTGRAISVLRYLDEAGLPESDLRAIGYADTQPLESNDTRAGRAANRRVELLLTQDS
ncbi:OmpA/MotB family protein [Halomonas daqiaonensis]|uniref:Chemotaxis protein MotB n=1 Tax=Halomonas daqiaonensis TaxID=650850 RepID=A0A1H7ST36_9GAMM|nr:OmpA family protein [Halomonas daqiaonensis]SEL75780.1 chemotaxis protein MotB [Halomonas daqiaonensis]